MMQSQHDAWIWAPYFAGQLLHILKRAGMTVRSKSNSLTSRLKFIAFYWDSLLIRVSLCAGLFWVLLHNPRALTEFFAPLSDGAALDISVNHGSALILGYFADSILDWLVSKVPLLQRDLPVLNGNAATAK